jgi:hypothetical protein
LGAWEIAYRFERFAFNGSMTRVTDQSIGALPAD